MQNGLSESANPWKLFNEIKGDYQKQTWFEKIQERIIGTYI